MKQTKHTIFYFLSILLLVSLACGGDSQVKLPDPNQVSTQAAAAATTATSVAATAAVAAAEAGDVAATAAASEEVAAAAETAVSAATSQAEGGIATAVSQVENSTFDMDALRAQLAAVQPDGNGSISVTITDDQLNQVLQAQQSAAPQAKMQNAQVQFSGGNIVLTGDVTDPVSALLTATFRPYVVNGTLQFEVISASIGNTAVPAPLLQTAESSLNNTLGQAMSSLPAGVTLQDVIMGEGTMTITGGQA